jgi:hypothetical protein
VRHQGAIRRQIEPGVEFVVEKWRRIGDTERRVGAFPWRLAPAMSRNALALSFEARKVLNLNQRTLGELLGLSRRTIQRWDAQQTAPAPSDIGRLAIAVHPRDPKLAAQLAAEAGTTLDALGLIAPSPPPPPLPPPPPAPAHLTDVVVCAAAEALSVPPQTVRPPLLAAFRRARELGLSVDDVERTLRAVLERPQETKKPKTQTT